MSTASQNLTLRLSPGLSGKNTSGLVEVFDGISEWGYICGSSWDYEDADVVCHQLGYSKALRAFTEIREHEHHEYFINFVNCGLSRKISLEECMYYSWTTQPRYCESGVAGVDCFSKYCY